ncbi:sulfatase-like hydrolase/transferase [Rhodospirillales bacterium]|nr:sulfatase-like hydrolase/transferase [Rhodospirillales bacterium]
MHSPPNVLFLTVDALRADRTTPFGYERSTTPSIARLADEGLLCRNCYSLGPVTQMALIQLLTSTRPLSYGGYDNGAIGRPPTLFKAFQDAGYNTVSLSTLHWVNQFFGYGAGVDKEYQLFGIITLPGVAFAMMRGTLHAYETDQIDNAELVRHIKPVLQRLFTNLAIYCEKYESQIGELKHFFSDSAMMNSGYDHSQVLEITKRHEAEFNADHFRYIERYLLPTPEGSEWMQRWIPLDWHYARKKSKLVTEMAFWVGNKILALFDPDFAAARKNRFKIYPDASSVANKTIDAIKTAANDERPFFIWTHFLDTHLPYVSGKGRTWYKETPQLLGNLGYDKKIPAAGAFGGEPSNATERKTFSALYDAALLSTDQQIGHILDALSDLGLEDNTIVAVAGDHGEELGEFGHFGHFFRLHRYATQVPCVIRAPGLPQGECKSFSTIMDIAPTLLELANIQPPSDWEGVSLVSEKMTPQASVLIETFYSGNCLFEHRPLYFAVRNNDYFFIWREAIDPSDTETSSRCELYDLKVDPDEVNNIYNEDHPSLLALETIIAYRMAEIPEIENVRIKKSFPWYENQS